jgi:hypothetical protein
MLLFVSQLKFGIPCLLLFPIRTHIYLTLN